jgi:hypothetical protein
MPASWTLAVARDSLTDTRLVEHDAPEPADGEALLRVDRVGMTANNVTYAVLGDAMRYWDFFPADAAGTGWGLVPLWGYAEVAASRAPGVEAGARVYGYYPPAGHLLVRPGRGAGHRFKDTSEHRAHLPSTYNTYLQTGGDPVWSADTEDLLILYRPLYFTSYMLADQLLDDGFSGAQALVFSSASSKTAYGAAFELRGRGPALVGLTSERNVPFTRSLGLYDEVLTYADVAALERRPAAYVDLLGAAGTRAAVRARLGDDLVRDVAVGITGQAADFAAAGEFFFAPDRMRKRIEDWGRDGVDARFAESWQRFAASLPAWVDVTVGQGAEALRDAWLETVAGTTPPRTGHVIAL